MTFKIDKYSEQIVNSVSNNELTIISTSTGSGKTMRVPQICHDISGRNVYCLVPRVVMARQASEGANKLLNRGGNFAGVMSGRGDKNGVGVTYATEGSFISRGIIKKMVAGDYLIIDEVHEQGANTAMLLYLCKSWIKDKGIKVVLLSATLDIDKYANYFAGFSVGTINMPDSPRPYEIQFMKSDTPIRDIALAALDGGRCLIGVSGKKDIDDTIRSIKRIDANIETFPVHGELEVEDMDNAISYKGAAVYVATNIVQSGVTIPNLTHGYFAGYGKRIVSRNGTSALEEYLLSKAEMTQWHGRIGRNCNGIIFVSENGIDTEREKMPAPEICLVPLLDTYINFMRHGISMYDVDLVDNPPIHELKAAKDALSELTLIASDELTWLGKAVAKEACGVRMGIVRVLGDLIGLSNTARKIAAINYVGHPFRNTTFKKGEHYSDYQVWISKIDEFVEQFGGKVANGDRELFKQKAESMHIFRRSLVRLMSMFEQIDLDFVDKASKEEGIFIKALMYFANCDRKVSYYSYTSPSFKSSVRKSHVIVGDVISVGAKTFVEGVTALSEEDVNIIESVFRSILKLNKQ